jgi:hypothetical protein
MALLGGFVFGVVIYCLIKGEIPSVTPDGRYGLVLIGGFLFGWGIYCLVKGETYTRIGEPIRRSGDSWFSTLWYSLDVIILVGLGILFIVGAFLLPTSSQANFHL